jgi:acyl transferase domain-containing protein
MLKVAAEAMKDSGFEARENRPNMGVIIGMEFDFEATQFHLRWRLPEMIKSWEKQHGLNLSETEMIHLQNNILNALGHPLTTSRTLGALGGVIASRIAKEFCLGGPSFSVSCEKASGLKALEIAIRSLQQHETDTILVGAVDLCCDIRNMLSSSLLGKISKNNTIRPFDRLANGSLSGEGAVALVVKRHEDAIKDGNRIYSVIKGVGTAGGGSSKMFPASTSTYLNSLSRCLEDAGVSPFSIDHVETNGSSIPMEDDMEATAIHDFFSETNPTRPFVGSLTSNIGSCGAVSGLAAVAKSSLCLYHQIIPPLLGYLEPRN